MSLQTYYNKFAKAIELTWGSKQYKDAREKDDMITPKVEAAFKDKGYVVHSNFMQGSLKSNTGVVPVNGDDYDIDRAIAIEEDGSPDNPVEPKKVLKNVLSDHGFSNPRIKKPCVTADYASKPLHIDFPVYRVDEYENYQLAVGKEHSDENNRSWDDADPKGLNDWITSDDNHQGGILSKKLTPEEKRQFYRLVRYIKRWRDIKYTSKEQRDKIYSIALTIMMKKSFCPCIDGEGTPDDHTALKNTIEAVLEDGVFFSENWSGDLNLEVYLPVTPKDDVFKGRGDIVATVLQNRLIKLLEAIEKAEDEESDKKACGILQKQFGSDFPEGDDNGTTNNSRVKSSTPGFVGVSTGA